MVLPEVLRLIPQATVGFLFLSYGVDFERDRGNNKNERLCFTIFFFLSIAERGGFPF
jgi:hypothetical protein